MKDCLDGYVAKHTPLLDNICHDCGGKVTKKVSSYYQGRIYYSSPTCQNCGRLYLLAKNVSTEGERAFFKTIAQPFTV
ncbi:MAG: hypothetical protein WA064_00545 [Candidatus Moraniibacteriota bacterium]